MMLNIREDAHSRKISPLIRYLLYGDQPNMGIEDNYRLWIMRRSVDQLSNTWQGHTRCPGLLVVIEVAMRVAAMQYEPGIL
jgi:hypothetical protein